MRCPACRCPALRCCKRAGTAYTRYEPPGVGWDCRCCGLANDGATAVCTRCNLTRHEAAATAARVAPAACEPVNSATGSAQPESVVPHGTDGV